MLPITISAGELFDEATLEFISIDRDVNLQLEHSLVSLSRWESKWKKPFLNDNEKSYEETIDYVRCMTLNKNIDPNIYRLLSSKNLEEIKAYINDPMTATTITNRDGGGKREILTSEVIYYDMIALNIPIECEKWHLNRLLMLIQVSNIKSQPGKKMSNNEILRSNKALNDARKKQYGTRG